MAKSALIEGERICEFKPLGQEYEVANPLFWAEVPDDTTTQDTYVNGQVVKYEAPPPTRRDVHEEAEARLIDGLILANGERWRCDPISMDRISSMLNSTLWPKSFKTYAGADVTLTDAAEARIIFDQCDTYMTAVLEASKNIQNLDPIPEDYDNDARWPSDGS